MIVIRTTPFYSVRLIIRQVFFKHLLSVRHFARFYGENKDENDLNCGL